MKNPSLLDSALIRLGNLAMSRGGRKAALAVLTFHRILPEHDPILPSEPDADTFAKLVDLIASNFNVLRLSEAVRRMAAGSLPANAACLTFDDGYANNYTVALPILAARDVPASVFVATGFLDGGRMFNDTIIESVRRAPAELDLNDLGLGSYRFAGAAERAHAASELTLKLKYLEPQLRSRFVDSIATRAGLGGQSDLMLTREQVRALHRAGVEIGAHTVNHPILTQVGAETSRNEIVSCKRELEEMIGAPVTLFAYPNGKPGSDYDRRHVELVRDAGFEAAFSTAWGAAFQGCDLFQLPRIAPWGRTPLRYGFQIAASYRERKYAHAR